MHEQNQNSPDRRVLEKLRLETLDRNTLRRYRAHLLENAGQDLEVPAFLQSLGAADLGADGTLHPTAAGLLMFGREPEIVRAFPAYALEYRRQQEGGADTERLLSSSGTWSGNLCDFYLRVRKQLTRNLPIPGDAAEREAVRNAILEALTNCIVHADYERPGGLLVTRQEGLITFSDPGTFCVEVTAAKAGGVSVPRNAALFDMFRRMRAREGSGHGLADLCAVWQRQGWRGPIIEEQQEPARTTLLLCFGRVLPKHEGTGTRASVVYI